MDVAKAFVFIVFTSYFLLIGVLFWIILRSLPLPHPSTSKLKTWVFLGLTIGSLLHTWFYMFNFMLWSFRNYEAESPTSINAASTDRLTSWLLHTSLFRQAWAAVCFGPFNWWWSEQLCLYTAGAWTVLLATEGKSNRIKHLWAYMLLGQLVAISVASNLFYLALFLSSSTLPPSSRHPNFPLKTAPLSVVLPVLTSLLIIAVLPFTNERTFLPNLLLMHGLLVVPLFPSSYTATSTRFSINIRTLYILITVIALALRTKTIQFALGSLPPTSGVADLSRVFNMAVHDTLYSHPAQSSIGWDVVWTTGSLVVWMFIGTSRRSLSDILVTLVGIPMDGVGAVAPWLFRKGIKTTETKQA
ncbi:hypothetical protein L208DRAFT_1368328 [Tricholoma matsutake]|nr:hypothetical protein L208DRAFT_1368328 [Tricholoma matsutake 945]